MKTLLEFLPIALFVAVYFYTSDIKTATLVLVPATAVQIIMNKIIYGKIEKMQVGIFIILLIMVGFTFTFDNPIFIKLKPTVAYVIIALVFLFNLFWGKALFLHSLLSKNLELPEKIWRKLSGYWIGFCLFSAVANTFVAFYTSELFWVNYKLFGQLGFTVLFFAVISFIIYPHIKSSSSSS